MNHRTAGEQTTRTRLSHSLSTRLSANGRFQYLLIALLLVTWSLTGAHSATMAALSTDLSAVNAVDATTHHAATGSHHSPAANAQGDTSLTHDHCVDHCLSAMLPESSPGVTSREVTLPPEIHAAHWEPWRADLTPPPPKPGSFASLS